MTAKRTDTIDLNNVKDRLISEGYNAQLANTERGDAVKVGGVYITEDYFIKRHVINSMGASQQLYSGSLISSIDSEFTNLASDFSGSVAPLKLYQAISDQPLEIFSFYDVTQWGSTTHSMMLYQPPIKALSWYIWDNTYGGCPGRNTHTVNGIETTEIEITDLLNPYSVNNVRTNLRVCGYSWSAQSVILITSAISTSNPYTQYPIYPYPYSVPSTPKPRAYINYVTPSTTQIGETVYFRGYAATIDGFITDYEWRSSIDGFLSDKMTFNTSNLSLGDHTIYFRAMDNKGVWSDWVVSIVPVKPVGLGKPDLVISSDDIVFEKIAGGG